MNHYILKVCWKLRKNARARTTEVKTYVEQSNDKSLQTKGQTIISVYRLLYNLGAAIKENLFVRQNNVPSFMSLQSVNIVRRNTM